MDPKIMDGVRRLLLADLQALIDGRLTDADKKRIYAAADRVLMIPRTDADWTVAYPIATENFEAAIAHGMRLLLAKPEFQDLKQCQWRLCNRSEDAPELPYVRKFFFVSQRREAQPKPTGKPPDRYCCEEHMQAAHRERAAKWTQDRRKELKVHAAARAAAKHK